MDKYLSSTRNQLVQHLKKVYKSRQYRLAHQSAIIQGKKLFSELAQSLDIKHLLLLPSDEIPSGIDSNNVYQINESILKHITQLPSPEGILAEVSLPQQDELNFSGKTLLLDGLQDPGNLGTLIRSALAFSFQRVVTLSPSVDFFNDKVIRSSKGAVFKIPCYELSWESFKEASDLPSLFVGHTEGTSMHAIDKTPDNFVLALGSEAAGPREELLSMAKPITIPIANEMESLNVSIAGGILLNHFSQLGAS